MGLGAWLVQSGTSQGAAVAPATTQFHWQDPEVKKPSACFSVLGVAGSSLGGTSYPNTCLRSPKVSALKESALARLIAPAWATTTTTKKKKSSSIDLRQTDAIFEVDGKVSNRKIELIQSFLDMFHFVVKISKVFGNITLAGQEISRKGDQNVAGCLKQEMKMDHS